MGLFNEEIKSASSQRVLLYIHLCMSRNLHILNYSVFEPQEEKHCGYE